MHVVNKLDQKSESPTEVKEVVFRFVEGENEGVEIRVTPPRELFVGRSEECDIFLGEKKISRKHSKIAVTSSGVELIDLKSTNGTYVNSKKVDEITIQNDDKIRIGTSLIQVAITTGRGPSKSTPESTVLREDEISVGTVNEPMMPVTSIAEDPEDADDISGVADIPSVPDKPKKPASPPPAQESKTKPLSGNLSAMGLADLLQNLAQNQKNGVLQLSAGSEGQIWVVKGRVVGAEVGRAHGVKALYRMLGWNEGTFEFQALPQGFNEKNIDTPITESIEGLLMEGFRQFDELEKIKKGLPALEAQLKMKPKFSAPLSKLHPRVLDVLQVVMNEGQMQDVLDASPLSDLETSKVIFYLIKKEYIVSE